MPTSLREDIVEEINEAVAKAMSRISGEFEHGARDAKRAARASQEAVAHAAREFAHDARELAHDASVEGRRLAVTARREVSEHPIAAIAIGAAVGTLFGLLIAQRK